MEQKIIDKILKERRKNPNLTYYVQKKSKNESIRTLCATIRRNGTFYQNFM